MCLLILVAYVPVMGVYTAANISVTLHPRRTYDFHRMHYEQTPYPWDTVLFVPSWVVPSLVLNQPWIPIATSAAIVGFFGTGAEARGMYRWYGAQIGKWCLFCCRRWIPYCGRKNGGNKGGGGGDMAKKNKGWWRWFARKEINSRNGILLHSLDSRGGNDSSSPRDNGPPSPLVIPKRGSILPTVEPSYQQPSSSQDAPTPIPATGPPAIPPRHSSLRYRFTFRKPTLPSLSLANIRLPSLPESISGSLSSLTSRSTSRLGFIGATFGFGRAGERAGTTATPTTGHRGGTASKGSGAGCFYSRKEKGKGPDLAITYSAAGLPSSESFGRSFSYPFSSAYSYWGAARRAGGGHGGLSVQEEEEGIEMLAINAPSATTGNTNTTATAAHGVVAASRDALPRPNPAYPFGRRNAIVPPNTGSGWTPDASCSDSESSDGCIRIPIARRASSTHCPPANMAATTTSSSLASRKRIRLTNKSKAQAKRIRRTPSSVTPATPCLPFPDASPGSGGGGGDGMVLVPHTTTTVTGGRENVQDHERNHGEMQRRRDRYREVGTGTGAGERSGVGMGTHMSVSSSMSAVAGSAGAGSEGDMGKGRRAIT
ncbi:hypothetical protein F4810DRAFT_662149 [Camillea tinctor]|nr:hypothetical protein F4810DRAFT_662149 [Camillea tinctor]